MNVGVTLLKYPEPAPMTPAMSEYWQPQPKVVTPGKPCEEVSTAPSDAIVLFDGKDLSQWENSEGSPAGWTVHDGVFTVKRGAGSIYKQTPPSCAKQHDDSWNDGVHRLPQGV